MNILIYPLISLIFFLLIDNKKGFYFRYITSYLPLFFLAYLSEFDFSGVLNITLIIPISLLIQKLAKIEFSIKDEFIYLVTYLTLQLYSVSQDYISFYIVSISICLYQDYLSFRKGKQKVTSVGYINSLIIFVFLVFLLVFNEFDVNQINKNFETFVQILFITSSFFILIAFTTSKTYEDKFKLLKLNSKWLFLIFNFLILPIYINQFLFYVVDDWFWLHNQSFLLFGLIILIAYYSTLWFFRAFKISSLAFMSYNVVSITLLNVITSFQFDPLFYVGVIGLFILNVMVQFRVKWEFFNKLIIYLLLTIPLTPLFILKFVFISFLISWGNIHIYLLILYSLLPLVFIKKFTEKYSNYEISS